MVHSEAASSTGARVAPYSGQRTKDNELQRYILCFMHVGDFYIATGLVWSSSSPLPYYPSVDSQLIPPSAHLVMLVVVPLKGPVLNIVPSPTHDPEKERKQQGKTYRGLCVSIFSLLKLILSRVHLLL